MAAFSAIWILFPLIKKKVGPPLAKLSGSAHGCFTSLNSSHPYNGTILFRDLAFLFLF